MKKLFYEKPEITIVELNEEIILASGPCVDVFPCADDAPVCLDCGVDL